MSRAFLARRLGTRYGQSPKLELRLSARVADRVNLGISNMFYISGGGFRPTQCVENKDFLGWRGAAPRVAALFPD
jgi:hypothetical protein